MISLTELIMEYVQTDASFLVLVLDTEGNILNTNRYTRELVGEDTQRQTLNDIIVDFTGTMKLSYLLDEPGRVHLLNVRTAGGLPQTFYFRFFRASTEILAIGEVNSLELEALRKGLIIANNELSNLGRELQKKSAEQKRAGEKIKSLLAEKELLLREVHHRIKNNMNVITSLLSLQADKLHDPAAIAALEDSGSRVRSMTVLYDKLYRSADFREISTKEYLTSLIDEIVGNFPNRGQVTIEKQIDDFILDAKTLSPVGMILNELLTNAMKHAFIGRDMGIIAVSLSIKDNHATLIVQDNGVGIPESTNIATSTGFGMHLVGILTGQLEGTVRIERDNGTKFILEFDI